MAFQPQANSRTTKSTSTRIILVALVSVLLGASCQDKPQPAVDGPGPSAPGYGMDFETPQGAILCLEEAYRTKDIDAAIRCKDFRLEARLMLETLKNAREISSDEEMLKETSEVLELAYRKEVAEKGFPDMNSLKCRFTDVQPHSDDVVIVTEVCRYPDGGSSTQRILVGKTAKGWRVLNPIE